MVLVATVTKQSVTQMMNKMWNITFNMVLTDDDVEVINKNYSVKYRIGDSVSGKTNKFIRMMQADINAYNSEQSILNNARLDAAVINTQTGLVV